MIPTAPSFLRPCPFCGRQPASGVFRGKEIVTCSNPDCANSTDHVMTLDAWNHRPLEDALLADNGMLRQQLDAASELEDKIIALNAMKGDDFDRAVEEIDAMRTMSERIWERDEDGNLDYHDVPPSETEWNRLARSE